MADAVQKSLVLVSLVILCCLSASAQTDQLLPEIDTYLKLSSDVRVSFQAKETREGGDPVQAEIGPSFDFYLKQLVRLKKVTTVRFGRLEIAALDFFHRIPLSAARQRCEGNKSDGARCND